LIKDYITQTTIRLEPGVGYVSSIIADDDHDGYTSGEVVGIFSISFFFRELMKTFCPMAQMVSSWYLTTSGQSFYRLDGPRAT
jgi:hypothetical protein